MENIQYVKVDGKFIKLHTEFDEFSVVKNEAYLIPNKGIYLYRGKYPNSGKGRKTGLYLKESGTFVTVGKSKISEEDIVKTDSEENIDSLITNIKKMEKTVEDKKDKISVRRSSTVREKRKLDASNRVKREEKLEFTIFEEDDPMVRIIKEKINSITFTMADIYDAVETTNMGYNLFYGLSTRPNMTWKTFEIWCKILNVEPSLTVKDIVD